MQSVADLTRQDDIKQVWIAWWHSCMRSVGATSLLPLDDAAVRRALAPSPASVPAAPRPDWAARLEGDERISDVTLSDVLLGLTDYFKIFREMKKVNPRAYEYFSRVGAPICFSKMCVRRSVFDEGRRVANPHDLPSYLGVFMTHTKEEIRDQIIKDEPGFLDFQVYEKRRNNIISVAPKDWTLYDHQQYGLDRGALTKAELRKFPGYGTFGWHCYIGVAPDGTVEALPMKMSAHQPLRGKSRGTSICHSRFVVPPGLAEMAGKRTVNDFVAVSFAAMRAFAASALSGVQLSVRKGDETARFGIPLANVRGFFRDRDREGARRRPLLHMVGGYHYMRGNREIAVGEHLRGCRHFTWRDYQLTISAPGIHHAAPEALRGELLTDEDVLPLPRDGVTQQKVAEMMQHITQTAPNVPFRKGQPTLRYSLGSFD